MMQCRSCDKKLRKNNLSGLCSIHYKLWWEQNKRDLVKKAASMQAWHLKNKEEFLSASHYTNTQPLWAKDNYTKRDSELRGTI